MADNNLRVPMTGGGLLRYYEESKSKIQIKPQYVIIMIAAAVIFEVVIRAVK
ncbi:MAG: preprotein translocase subunit Sec61beta [archaeon]